jgi:hypothetical protein
MGVPKWSGRLCRNGILEQRSAYIFNPFNYLAYVKSRRSACLFDGMNFWILFFAAQVVVSIVAVVREKKHNARFEGDRRVTAASGTVQKYRYV